MQATKDEDTSIEELEMVSKPIEHPMDLIVVPFPEKQNISLEEKYVVLEVSKEEQVIKVPHIDFIFEAHF